MSEAGPCDYLDSMNGGTVVELLPLTAKSGSDSPDETESRVVADEEDSSSQHSTSSSPVLSRTILSRVVLPLVLFALIAGILFMQGEYESEEQLEDIEYKNGQMQKIQTDSIMQQHDHDFNNNEVKYLLHPITISARAGQDGNNLVPNAQRPT